MSVGNPQWLAAAARSLCNAGQVNQFLINHDSTWLYDGAVQAAQATGIAVYTSTASQYLDEIFTTGVAQTGIGQVWLQVSTVGGSPVTATITPLTLSLYADAFGQPSGVAIASATLNEQFVYSSPFWVPFPLTAEVTPGTAYHLITSPAGTGTAYYVWQRSNQPSGAQTSPDAVTWTAQTYGLMYQVFDQSASVGADVKFISDDAGARWVRLAYDATGRVTTVTEYTVAQDGNPALQAVHTLTYTNGFLTGVT